MQGHWWGWMAWRGIQRSRSGSGTWFSTHLPPLCIAGGRRSLNLFSWRWRPFRDIQGGHWYAGHSMDGVLFCAGSLDGLWLIHDNYPSSIPLFYIMWDTLRNLTWLNWFYHILGIFLLYPIHYKILGYCWGNCHESTIIHPKNKHEIALHPRCAVF